LGTALTAGSHLSAAAEKEKGGRAVLGRRLRGVGPLGRPARAGKERKRPVGLARAEIEERERERERERVFLFLLNFSFKIHFFKHSNFNQTKIHAFKS
jgi:hypothetical protein